MYTLKFTDTDGVKQSKEYTDHLPALMEQQRLRRSSILASIEWDDTGLVWVGERGAAGVIDGKLPNGEVYHRNIRSKRRRT